MDDQYQPGIPVPGIRLSAQLRDAWQRGFAGWRPDERTVGVVLVALYAAFVVQRLLTVDQSWDFFIHSVQSNGPFPAPAQQAINATTQLLFIPVELVIVLGGVGLALTRRAARSLVLVGLAGLLGLDLVSAVNYISHAGGSDAVRSSIGQVVGALSPAMVLAVLLWSRPTPEGVDG